MKYLLFAVGLLATTSVSARGRSSSSDSADGFDDDGGICPHLLVDTKCAQNGDRVVQATGVTLESCRKKCKDKKGCEFFSYDPKLSGGYCMGCKKKNNADPYTGFKFYPMECGAAAAPAVLEKTVKVADIAYAFPPTDTNEMVHGLCVMGATSAKASSTDDVVEYTMLDAKFQSGTRLWGDRSYKAKGVDGKAMCEGGIYLQPSKHKSIKKGTTISMSAVPVAGETVTLCALIEYQHGQRDGQWDKTLPVLGFTASEKNFLFNANHEKMKGYCKTIGVAPVAVCDAPVQVNVKCAHKDLRGRKHEDRLFRTEDKQVFSVEQCQAKCAATDGCDFYSYSFPGSGNGYEQVCMGCTTDSSKDFHKGFHLFKDTCVGKEPKQFTTTRKPGSLCAQGTGDPHMTTFDGLKYDCQGEGDYIMSKSLEDSGFELQGRFEKVPGKSVTTHQGAVITTGFPNEPKVEIEYTKRCELSYRIDDALFDLENDADTGNDNVAFYASGKSRSFEFDSGFSLKVTLRSWRGDCLLNVYLCIPETVADQKIVGILGSPDGDKSNDFTTRDGTDLELAGKTTKRESHEHCVSTWCIPQPTANHFFSPIANDACEVPFDEEFDKLVENADPEIKKACGDVEACIIDTVAADGDIKEGLRTLEDEEEDPEPPGEDEIETPVDPMLAPPKEISVCEADGDSFAMTQILEADLDGQAEPGDEVVIDGTKYTLDADCLLKPMFPICAEDGDSFTMEYVLEADLDGQAEPGDEVTIDGTKYTFTTTCSLERVPEPQPEPQPEPAPQPETDNRKSVDPTPKKGSGSGDPHFKTWLGQKYDYHGECDLVLVNDPSFADGIGLRVHIRTTRVKHFSFISEIAIQIGTDVLEFDNDIDNFLINGEKVGENQQHHKTMLGGFIVRRDKKALSIRLHDEGKISRETHNLAKIDLHTRKNGFPAVIVDAGHTDVFKGSLGLLGEWHTGKTLARDGKTEMRINGVEDDAGAAAFALEWQVRDTEPMLFKDARFPQFPTTCTPPAKQLISRLGLSQAKLEAEEACAHWKTDMDDCIFDVMATRDILVAEEGHIVHIE